MRRVRRSKIVVFRLFIYLLPLGFLCLGGCMSLSSSKPPGAWYDAYETIDDPASFTFISNGLARATAEFGEPVIPINKILLRRSRKTKEARRYRIGENFSLTQCADSTNGLFVIYMGVDPDHKNYYPLLAHECAHLINAQITDWYMEGIATVFSEEFCEEQELVWGDWKRHFMKSRREPYALSYRMMLDLKEVFPAEYASLIQHPMPNGKGPEWLHIDIDRWLVSLPADRYDEALDIIEPHVSVLRKQINEQYAFKVPEALK